jgi:hypothetical protein
VFEPNLVQKAVVHVELGEEEHGVRSHLIHTGHRTGEAIRSLRVVSSGHQLLSHVKNPEDGGMRPPFPGLREKPTTGSKPFGAAG